MTTEPAVLLAALFEAHFDALLGYARRRTAQLSDAEDTVAEVFTIAWRQLGRLPADTADHGPWLYGIARRVLSNQRRGAARRRRLLERLREAVLRPTHAAQPVDAASALAQLPPADQEVLRLIAWEELSHKDAALVLGISPNAVAIRVHRARQRIKAVMKGSTSSRTSPGWKGNVSGMPSGDHNR